ncbi:bifunctional 3-demethylubiquinone-9 3-methyltransferase/ 2-octaprenyl-6-hydroxy phenol methylase [Roseibium album]|nr:bifunctional 3-demethylubiquinone-9 3-methyltransferase/ 2-octaprenyl-6-hydroxy phenol methylase [Roseibium album]
MRPEIILGEPGLESRRINLQRRIVAQFRKPHGLAGTLAGWIMANRASNIARNKWTVGLLSLAPGARVLEIGCGPGIGLDAVLSAAADTHVTGLDHSELMITKAAKRHANALKFCRLELVCGELTNLQSGQGFNAIFSCNVLQFVDDRKVFLTLAHNHLKTGGQFVTTYQPRGQCASADEGRSWISQFAEDLCQAGFTDVDVQERNFGKMPAFCAIAMR